MSYTLLSNANAPIFYGMLGISLALGLIWGFRNGGWNRNLPFMFTLIVFTQYFLISPIYFFITGKKRIIGTDISAYYGAGAFYAFLGVFFFVLGYLLGPKKRSESAGITFSIPNIEKVLTVIFFSVYGVVLVNMAFGGVNVVNLFIGNEVVGLGAEGASYYLQNFADSLITIVIVGYLAGVSRNKLIVWVLLSFFLFSLLGFRYRILLTLFGLLMVYLMKNKITIKQAFIGFVLSLLFLYAVVFSTANRNALILRQYDKVEFDLSKVKSSLFFEQTRGALADMTIYKVYDNPFKNVSHDYGQSMFAYIFVRMIPRFIYPEKDSFYPTPQTKVQLAALDAWWAKYAGESLLSNGCLYVAWGWAGIVIGSFMWGFFLRMFTSGVDFDNLLNIATYIVITLVSFQWITRAYFPQAVDHAVYMLVPVWVLRWLQKRYLKKGSSQTGANTVNH